jgi:hypothetical protein
MSQVKLVSVNSDRFTKCGCCNGQIRHSEPRWQLQNEKKRSQGTFCGPCIKQGYAAKQAELNDQELVDEFYEPCEDESHLRSMEDYAAYRYAGCESEYWNDRNSGYAN